MLKTLRRWLSGISKKCSSSNSKETKTLVKSIKKLSPRPGDILCFQLTEKNLSQDTICNMTEAISNALNKAKCEQVALLFLEPGIGLYNLEDLLEKTKNKVEKQRLVIAAQQKEEANKKGIL